VATLRAGGCELPISSGRWLAGGQNGVDEIGEGLAVGARWEEF